MTDYLDTDLSNRGLKLPSIMDISQINGGSNLNGSNLYHNESSASIRYGESKINEYSIDHGCENVSVLGRISAIRSRKSINI